MSRVPRARRPIRTFMLPAALPCAIGVRASSCERVVPPDTKYSPSLTWRTISTKHFAVEFHQGADYGNAWDTSADADNYRMGRGAELGTDMTFGYRFRIRVRIGVASGRDAEGEQQIYIGAGNAF